MNINLHIERLVLDGLPISRRDGSAVQAAVEVELTRLLAVGGLSPSFLPGGALPSVRANSIQVGNESTPVTLGQQIGASLGRALG